MKKPIRMIKKEAKERLHSNFGDAFIIIFIPFFIMNAITILTGQLIMFLPDNIERYADLVIQILLNIFASYMSLKMLIPYVREKERLSFNNFFKIEKGLFSFAALRILIALFFILMYLPIFPIVIEFIDTISIMVDINAIEYYIETSDIVPRLLAGVQITSALLLLFWLVTIRLQMIPFVIIDKEANLIQAIKISWNITKGNYFKILIFPFTYILWLLLVFTFFGIFYIIPLVFVGYGFLYLSMVDDNDEVEI